MWTDSLESPYLFFTGKGGVGKTSLACATAVHSARCGQRTLIVSTDPASNLDEVFGVSLANEPTPIPGAEGLFGANLDPEAAAAEYRERVVGPFRGKLPPAVIRGMEEQFSGACTTEIAAFDAFVRLMSDPEVNARFDRVVFDTAPTGHTLRLLSLPSAWSGYLNTTTAESSCLGPLAGLQDQRAAYAETLERLSDPRQSRVILVARPERLSLNEAERTRSELARLEIRNVSLIVNAVYDAGASDDPVAREFAAAVRCSLDGMPEGLVSMPRVTVPMLPTNIVGMGAIDALLGLASAELPVTINNDLDGGTSFEDFVRGLADQGSGVIMTMGKGGVGKTSVAARLATSLARLGHRVLLTTTDPAGDVRAWVRDAVPGLEVQSIDPTLEVTRYRESALERAAPTMDSDALALLEEDLRSPCTEEIAVFRAFAEAVAAGTDRFVVIDTAPTGHTILLMDATEAYHREVSRVQSDAPESVRQLLPRLRDPSFTRVVMVTLPEPTPVHEAIRLQDDLERAGIRSYGWVVNRSLAAAGVTEPLLSERARAEAGPIGEVFELNKPTVILPWSAPS